MSSTFAKIVFFKLKINNECSYLKKKGPVSLAQFILCNLLNLQQHFDMCNTNNSVTNYCEIKK